MKNRPQYLRILEKEELKTGAIYKLSEIPLSVKFKLSTTGPTYETITTPGIMTQRLKGCKRDCWNTKAKQMELLDYTTPVIICLS